MDDKILTVPDFIEAIKIAILKVFDFWDSLELTFANGTSIGFFTLLLAFLVIEFIFLRIIGRDGDDE